SLRCGMAATTPTTAMSQRNELGQRFRLEIESARAGAQEVRLPPKISLGWYAGEDAPTLHAGERWRMAVRLKAPHGNLNPHGFDYELWLWEHGVQATGYVRAGPNDPRPQRIGVTWSHPVERARQQVRTAIFERIADRKSAGLLAALAVGDQNAIDLGTFNRGVPPRHAAVRGESAKRNGLSFNDV
ncbi:MAG: DUF4131 domain-containing protein, partial [Burkholderiales bacterium]